jgi:hypothetical protein
MSKKTEDLLELAIEQMLGKLDRIDGRLWEIEKTLTTQQVILEDHIRRTELLEAKVLPLERSHSQIVGAMKLLAGLGSILGLIGTFAWRFFH